MKKIKLFFTAMMILLATGLASAQNIRVSGVVTDQNGAPVPGVTVLVAGSTTNGTSTGAAGEYTLASVPSNATLVFTSIGYTEVRIPVQGRSTVNARIEEDSEALEGTVVVGYGSAKKISSLVGSVSTVKSESLKNAPSSSALDALQGQVAGMSVLTSSGVAGDNAVSITLHGVGSLTSSTSPLFVIDGIPSSSYTIMSMNPNDIESISVLKDASATSIYGAQAANGVVYVSTKSGSYNTTAKVTARSQWGINTLADYTLYKSLFSGEQLKDFWVRAGIHSADWIKENFTDLGYDANTEWYKVRQNIIAPQSQNDVTIEGGGSKVAYMLSISQFHQTGNTIGNYYDRYTLRSNVQAHPLHWLKAGVNLSLSMDENQRNGYWGDSANASTYLTGGLSFLMNPLYSPYDENGVEYPERYPGLAGSASLNHHYYMEKNPNIYNNYTLNGNAFVEIEPVRNLKFTSRVGTDTYFETRNSTSYPSYDANNGVGSKLRQLYFAYRNTITNTAEYSFMLGDDHNISFLLGQEGIDYKYQTFGASSSGQNDDRLMRLQDGKQTNYDVTESSTAYRFLSFFAHADYSYQGKYILDGTLRRDSSSRFGRNHRNAFFWAAGAMWKLKTESFLQDVSAINDLNFKVSYGTQGNAAIGDYTSLGLISTATSYATGNSNVLAQPSNNDLTWEKQGLLTVSLTGKAFNFLDFELAFYDRRTKAMLLDVPQPYTTGFTEVTGNVGGMKNTGIDLTLGIDIIRKRDAYLRFSTTFGYNNQKVTELFDGRQRWAMPDYLLAYVVGHPIEFYLPLYAGIDPADGAPMWYVPGEDVDTPTRDPENVTKNYDEAALTQSSGRSQYAPINGGFSLSGGWKNFSVLADFTYVIGKNLYSNDAYFYSNPAYFSTQNAIASVSDFWTPNHTDAKFPDWSQGHVLQFADQFLEDASFLRLKNLQIGYSLPKAVMGWQNVVKGIKITATGRNLLTLTKYNGIDPEVDSNLTYGIPGNSRQVLGGIEITF